MSPTTTTEATTPLVSPPLVSPLVGPRRPPRGRRVRAAAVGVSLVALAALVGLVRPVVPVTVTSGSMSPTLESGATVLVIREPWAGTVRRGDVVVFSDPGGWAAAATAAGVAASSERFVKRAVAVGGDTVACCTGGRLTVDGVAVDEPYLDPGLDRTRLAFEVEVPAGTLWVMGDDRDGSFDSRWAGATAGGPFVPVSLVLGKVLR